MNPIMQKDLPCIWIIRCDYPRTYSRNRSFGIHALPFLSDKIKGPSPCRGLPYTAGKISAKDKQAIHICYIRNTIIGVTGIWLSVMGDSLNTVFRISSRQPRFSEAFNSEFLQIQGIEFVAVVVSVSSSP